MYFGEFVFLLFPSLTVIGCVSFSMVKNLPWLLGFGLDPARCFSCLHHIPRVRVQVLAISSPAAESRNRLLSHLDTSTIGACFLN